MFEIKALPAPPPDKIPANLQDALNTTLTDIERYSRTDSSTGI